MSIVKRKGVNYSMVAKLMHIYFHESLAAILNQIRRIIEKHPECHQRFYGKHFTQLKMYYNALVEFKNMWYLGIYKDEKSDLIETTDPWEWVLNFVEKADIALTRVLDCAPPNEKKFLKLRLKHPNNTYESWLKLREDYLEKLDSIQLNDRELIEESFINTDVDVF